MTIRYRSRNDDKDPTTWTSFDHTEGWSCGDPPITDNNTTGVYVDYGDNTTMTDVVTPGFKRLSARGAIINSPMTQVRTISRDNPCGFSYEFGKKRWDTSCTPDKWVPYLRTIDRYNHYSSAYFTDGMNGLPTVPAYDATDLIATAVSSAWANVSLNEAQALVIAGEGKKTILSFCSILKRLIKIIKLIKRRDAVGFQHLTREISLKSLSERYMELRYALRPFVYDVRGVSRALSEHKLLANDRITYRGHKTYSDSNQTSSTSENKYTDDAGDWTYDAEVIKTWSKDVSVRAGILTQLDEVSPLSIWGITEPIEAIWELVPFSFIVDWIFNVGDVLASWTPNYGLRTLASWYVVETRDYQRMARYHSNFSFPTGGTTKKGTSYLQDVTDCWCDRLTITKSRVPDPTRLTLPVCSLRLDGFKLVDLAIIAKGIFFRSR